MSKFDNWDNVRKQFTLNEVNKDNIDKTLRDSMLINEMNKASKNKTGNGKGMTIAVAIIFLISIITIIVILI